MVDGKLDQLLKADIVEPVEEPTPWVSPIVIVPKNNGDIRLCLDMRMANKAITRERYPLPTFEELLQELSGSRIFSKLDIKWAYHQIELEPASRIITTFSTHNGLFQYKTLVFGISCAPEMFQRVIHQVLVGCEGVVHFLDDLICHGKDRDEHDRRLEKLLSRLQEVGILLNTEKCELAREKIDFLGHEVSAQGIRPLPANIKAILEFRRPNNKAEVQSFLGLVNFCSRFIPNISTLNQSLRQLTRNSVPFKWGQKQQKAFDQLKYELTQERILGLYDKNAPTKVVTDASPVGLGAVLIQVQEEGPKIISYASRSLTEVEKRYSQTEKEGLAVVWSCERFKMYLIGKEFELITDHKPLECIYSSRSKPCARMERWVLRMQSFNYKVKYQPGKTNIADLLSRLLRISPEKSSATEVGFVFWLACNTVPRAITMRELEEATAEDLELMEVKEAIRTSSFTEKLRAYKFVQQELCYVGNILLRGTRILIPKRLRQRILSLGHEGHPGMSSMKKLLRCKVWWPKIDKDVEQFCRTCKGCQLTSSLNPPEPMSRMELPERPWEHVAIDFQGPLPSGHNLLVVVDYYSRYMEVAVMNSITTEKTVEQLEEIFARHGYPYMVHSDNGPQLVRSQEYREYMAERGICTHNTTPWWPQANGEVERQNRTILKRLKIAHLEGKNWKQELQKFLLMYRSTPHTTTGVTPAQALFNREIRNKLPSFDTRKLNDEEMRDRDWENKEKGREYADRRRHAVDSDIQPGDKVVLKQPRRNKLSSTFGETQLEVVEKKGNALKLKEPGSSQTFWRNSQHCRKFYEKNPLVSETIATETVPRGSMESELTEEPGPSGFSQSLHTGRPPDY